MRAVVSCLPVVIIWGLLSVSLTGSAIAEQAKGNSIIRELLEYVVSRDTLSCTCTFDVTVKNTKLNQRFTGSSHLAFDLRNRAIEEIGVRADTTIKGQNATVVARSLGLKVRSALMMSGEPPIAFTMDFSSASMKNSSSKTGDGSGGFSKKELHTFFTRMIADVEKALTPKGRKALCERALKRTYKYTTVEYVAPNGLKFHPKKGPKQVSEIYYDRNTKLVNSLLAYDPHSGVTVKLVFSNWVIDDEVTLPEEPSGVRYRAFNQQILGKILGTVLSVSSSTTANTSVQTADFNFDDKLKSLDSATFRKNIRQARESAGFQ